jgi:phosphoenolpyruvate carboxylase
MATAAYAKHEKRFMIAISAVKYDFKRKDLEGAVHSIVDAAQHYGVMRAMGKATVTMSNDFDLAYQDVIELVERATR